MCNKAILENGRPLESVPNQYKTQEMCGKAADNYAHVLKFVLDSYKTRPICIETFKNYPSTLLFVPESYKTQKMCDKAADTCFAFDSVFDWLKTQEIWDKAADNYAHTLKVVPDWYKTEKKCLMKLLMIILQYNLFLNAEQMCNKALNACFFFYFILFLIDIRLKKSVMKQLMIVWQH